MAKRTLLIPSLLDDYFPLLQYVFASDRWDPVLLTEEKGLADLGLRYIHSDMCYPAHLVAGQVLAALRSGKYDTDTCGVLVGQAGDECRGGCFVQNLRKALARAGFPKVVVLSANVRGLEKENRVPIRLSMIPKALAGAVWGDTLAILRDQTRPFEAVPGSTLELWRQWMDLLGTDLREGHVRSRKAIFSRCREIIASFQAIEKADRPVQKVAVVGEIYTKFCHLGNWDLREYLAKKHCQTASGGLTWYALYYMDSHALKGNLFQRGVYRLVQAYTAGVQRQMLRILHQAGYETLPPLAEVKRQARGYAPLRVTLADGWLITAEATAFANMGYRKILCVQPFACLPGHIFGKGQYTALQRKLPGVRLVSVDYDASTGEGTVQSRIRMLLDEQL